MKKIYALVAGLVLTGAVSAQVTEIISGGGFEGTFVNGAQIGQPANLGGHTSNMSSLDWVGPGFTQASTAITGSKSAKVTSIDDAAAAEAFWGAGTEPKTSGVAQQIYEGDLPVQDPNEMVFKFKYQYAPVGADTAFAIVQILDTNNTGNAQVLWQGMWIEWNAVATATEAIITTWQATGSTGTANTVAVLFGTSLGNFYDDTPAPIGSVLTLDDVSWTYTTVSVNEVSKVTSKVYPNPTSDVLNIEVSNGNATSINIYGVDGKVVATETLNGIQSTINVSNLNNGVYFYNITTVEGSVMNGSFVKQ